MSDTIPLPYSEKGVDRAITNGYLPAYPPQDYTGSIADWCIAMGEAGVSFEYKDLCSIMVRKELYKQILSQCEGDDA